MVVEPKRKILLVSEDAKEAGAFKKILTSAPPGVAMNMCLALNLPTALKVMSTDIFDAIVVDLSLKDNALIAVLDAIKVYAKDVPVIALRELTSEKMITAVKQLGVDDYVVNGQLGGESLLCVLRYAVERRHAVQALRECEQRFRRLVEISPDPIFAHSDGKFVLINDAAANQLGATGADHLIGKPVESFVHSKIRAAVADDVAHPAANESSAQAGIATVFNRDLSRQDGWLVNRDITANACSYHVKPAPHDVTELKRLENRLSYLALHDVLTALPNRSQFRERLNGAMARATRNKQLVAIMFIGLDRFQTVNAAQGREAGDLVLKQIAERLSRAARKSDTLARIGGDEFGVILEGLAEKQGAAVAAQRVLELLAQPMLLDGKEIKLTASIGISVFSIDAADLEALLRNADVAMHFSAAGGGNTHQYYSPELDERSRRDEIRRTAIEHRLARLTPREREVLDMIVDGKASKMAAYLLGISTRTIDNHRAKVMDKMEADSLPDLVRMSRDLVALGPGFGHRAAAGA